MSEDQTANRPDMTAGAGAEIDDQGPQAATSGAGLEDHTDFQQVREDLVRAEAQAEEMDWWYQLVMNEGNAKGYWIQLHWPGYLWSRAGWRAPFTR